MYYFNIFTASSLHHKSVGFHRFEATENAYSDGVGVEFNAPIDTVGAYRSFRSDVFGIWDFTNDLYNKTLLEKRKPDRKLSN